MLDESPFLGSGYGAIVTVLSVVALTLSTITVRLVTRPRGVSDQNDRMVAFVLLAAVTATLVSAIRVWLGAEPLGDSLMDSGFRVVLTGLRVFIILALGYVVIRETGE